MTTPRLNPETLRVPHQPPTDIFQKTLWRQQHRARSRECQSEGMTNSRKPPKFLLSGRRALPRPRLPNRRAAAASCASSDKAFGRRVPENQGSEPTSPEKITNCLPVPSRLQHPDSRNLNQDSSGHRRGCLDAKRLDTVQSVHGSWGRVSSRRDLDGIRADNVFPGESRYEPLGRAPRSASLKSFERIPLCLSSQTVAV